MSPGAEGAKRRLDGDDAAIIAAIAAFSARETFRIHLNDLGAKDARPVPVEEYERLRATAVAA